KLVYSAIMSIDGYIADADGDFSWAEPDAEVHEFVNDQTRRFGTHLYGRRLYEMMTGWETDPSLADESPLMRDFAQLWQAADKLVYSSSLGEVVTERTRLERTFEAEAVRRLKDEAEADLLIGGPGLAAHAFAAGLVDECELYLVPVSVGGGKPGLPAGVFVRLKLVDLRRFGNGTVMLRYRVGDGAD
ncbi:MAG: dihydrofolate reductase family protein, partial [Stackebrandtia sp.]